MSKAPYTKEQLDAAKNDVIRRYTGIKPIARMILAEMMSYDYPIKGKRKGSVWVSQQQIADNLNINRRTVVNHIPSIISSPFIQKVTKFRDKQGAEHCTYYLDWEQIYKHTSDHLDYVYKVLSLEKNMRKA